MASSKLYKPTYSYGATKSNYSESHQEYSTQSSSWANLKQPSYNYQAHENQMGRSMQGGGGDAYGHGSANKSTNYYAQAHCAQPSPSINVVQSTHVVETMKKQESPKGQECGDISPKCASPAQSARSEFAMHQEEHMTGKTDQGWAKKPNYVSGAAQVNHYGLEVHNEEHMMGKMEQGWDNKPTQNSTMGLGNQYGNMMGKVEQGWANSSNQCSSPITGNKHGLAMHKEEHMMEKVETGLVSKPTQFSGPARVNQYGQSMYKEQEEKAYNYSEGGVEKAWATKPINSLGPNQSNYSMQGMYKEHEQDGYGNNHGKYSSPIYTNNNGLGVHKEDHMMGMMDQGWPNSPTKFSGPQSNHSNLGMYKEEHMMGKVGHGANSSRNFSGPTKTNNSGLTMCKEEHMIGKSDHALLSPVQGNQYGQSMYKEQDVAAHVYGGNSANGGWAANQPAKYSGDNELGYSSHNMYKEQAQNGFGAYINGHGPAPINYPAHSVAQNGLGSAHNGYGVSGSNHSAHGVPQTGFGEAQVNHSGYGVAHNGLGTVHGLAHNGYGAAQVSQSAHALAQNGYGSAQTNYSGHGAHNFQDNDEDHEGVHDIMDEILSKYPAHNVSGGHGSSWAANQGAGYAKQQSFGGPAQQGIVRQSSSNKFEMKKEVKAGYMAKMKEEYSHSSSSNRLEVKGLRNNGGLCSNRVESHDECDF